MKLIFLITSHVHLVIFIFIQLSSIDQKLLSGYYKEQDKGNTESCMYILDKQINSRHICCWIRIIFELVDRWDNEGIYWFPELS